MQFSQVSLNKIELKPVLLKLVCRFKGLIYIYESICVQMLLAHYIIKINVSVWLMVNFKVYMCVPWISVEMMKNEGQGIGHLPEGEFIFI